MRADGKPILYAGKPFGTTDGYGTKDIDPLNTFVSFHQPGWQRGIAMKNDDRSVRVIVGKKGAGKSLYLRRLQAAATAEDAIYADKIQTVYPRTEHIVRVGELYPEWNRVEKWSGVWRAAILRSTVTHLLCKPELRESLTDGDELELRHEYNDLYSEVRKPRSIYAEFSDICYFYEKVRDLDKYLDQPRWADLEAHLAEILARTRPMFFYLDAIDEKFGQAPRHWTDCQLGLFYQVMNLLNNDELSGKLNVVICVRDLVYSRTQETEHLTRYWGEPHIHVLDWDNELISYFLAEKLESLPGQYFVSAAGSPTVDAWLGVNSVENEVKRRDEQIERYLLRHTRLIPRDIVALGNEMCSAIVKLNRGLSESVIRGVISRTARKSGVEQLMVCANQIAAEMMPAEAAARGYDSFFTGEDLEQPEKGSEGDEALEAEPDFGDEDGEEQHFGGTAISPLHATIARQLREALAVAKKDRIGLGVFDRFRSQAEKHFGTRIDVPSILWQNGLLGHLEGAVLEGATTFYRADREDDLELPVSRKGYVLHPILIDTIPAISGIGAPVSP